MYDFMSCYFLVYSLSATHSGEVHEMKYVGEETHILS